MSIQSIVVARMREYLPTLPEQLWPDLADAIEDDIRGRYILTDRSAPCDSCGTPVGDHEILCD